MSKNAKEKYVIKCERKCERKWDKNWDRMVKLCLSDVCKRIVTWNKEGYKESCKDVITLW